MFYIKWCLGMVLLIMHPYLSKGNASHSLSSCNATHIQVVESCPESQRAWEEQAKLKNCSSLTQPCRTPDKLQYHCLVNTFLNATISICATPTFINGYRCAEYNLRGESIQPNYDTNCSLYNPPCPFRYDSRDAFLYQGCYKLIQRDNSTLSEILSFVSTTESNKEMTRTFAETFWPILSFVLALTVLTVVCFVFQKFRRIDYNGKYLINL
ncbi:uncharacterized protein LOC134268867 [Saccostrea cucullata]|uniref:uncharacterized protein LOC134268867 n=1 Tax=Saccostrea cuccullata TaxID=36930 RepID=UPI002ED2A568